MNEKTTKGVKTLLGNPKKAIIKISVPMMVGMGVQTLYNLVDGIWVAGLGPDALAAVGLFFPIFIGLIAIANGIGIGGSSAISRKIGAKDKKAADSVGEHSILLGISIGILITISIYPLLHKIFNSMGAKGNVVNYAITYAEVLVAGIAILIFTNIGNGILRGEGDTKRAMYAMILGSGLNIILDPIFIYIFHMGVVGAAWATLASIAISAVLIFYWIFIKHNMYVTITFKNFKIDGIIISEILKVGIPSSLAQLSMSVTMFVMNIFIVRVGGTNGIAIFTSAWRIIMVGIMPLLGIAIGTTAVTGAAYGAKNIDKLNTAYLYAIELGVKIEAVVMVLVLIFAPQVSILFTYSKIGAHISKELIQALRLLSLFLVFAPLGILTSSMFQGIGQGEKALIMTVLRTIIMQILFAYIFGLVLQFGLIGIWWGMIIGNASAAIIGFVWGKIIINHLK